MKKSKVVLGLAGIFCVLFLVYLKNLDYEMANLENAMLSSPNVKDVTDDIETRFYVSSKQLTDASDWTSDSFDESDWKEIKIPSHRVTSEPNFNNGNFAYYRIHVPVNLMRDFAHLKNEVSLGLYIIQFSKVDVYVNGKLKLTISPGNINESVVVVPLDEARDNLITVRGIIKTGDTGINHRTPIMLGRGVELNQLYSKSYKAQTVFTLIYILCKGSILFIFALIFFVVRVDKFFEKFLMFGMFVVSEDVLRGDFLNSLINLHYRVYLYNLVNIGISIYLFLFLSDVVNKKFKRKNVVLVTSLLTILSSFIAYDILNHSYVFQFDQFLKFWNIILMLILVGYVPKMIKVDPISAAIMCLAAILTGWSAFFSENVGHNLKAVGNLLLFFMAAYQTFILFKKEQDLLIAKQVELLEQEKDVAIGRTAALLAHDVRRPLEQMNLILNKISHGNVSDEFLKTAKKDVDFSLTSVNNQINDIMNFSRTKEIHLEPINLYKVLSGSLKQVLTITKNVEIALQYDFKANYLIMGDESRLSSVLTNVISNAVEAIRDIGQKNSGNIKLSTYIHQNSLRLKIANDGPGIPAELINEIFKPLFTHGKNKGTGLGLASVAKTMNDHKGSIKVSNINKGVEFELSFQIGGALDVIDEDFKDKSALYSYESQTKVNNTNAISLRVFVLDDDAQVYEYIKFLTDQLAYDIELTFTQSIEEAKKIIHERRFDLYILDYDLGYSTTGLDFYHAELGFLNKEVVIHTNRDKDILNKANCGYQQKPMSLTALQNAINDVYQNRLKIMIVDDSELTLMVWELFHGKHNIVTVKSPEEALSVLTKVDVDCCVLDYYFDNSKMTGDQLGLEILKTKQDLAILIATNAEVDNCPFPIIQKSDCEIRKLVIRK